MRIALLGDIALIGKYDLSLNKNAKKSIKKISEYLKTYDLVIGNLETPLTDRDKTFIPKSMHLKTPSVNIDLLKYLNISVVSLANNHSYDYGRNGLEDTMKILEDNKIEYFGIDGKNIIINKISISGFCCYSTNAVGYNSKKNNKGINTLTFEKVTEQVRRDKTKGLLSLLSFHWGDEHTNYPRYDHIKFARFLTEQNDIIINGHHAHVIQGVEKYKNSLIAYCQGNFCFDDCSAITGTGLVLKQNEWNRESYILEVNIENNKINYYKAIGIREVNDEIILDSVSEKLDTISSEIKEIKNIEKYEKKRKEQFSNPELRLKKFGKRNFKWFIKRLNYYSIGAFILTKINVKKYYKEFSSYL